MSDFHDFFGEPISSYSRAQALEDGVLIDATEWASAGTGFFGGFRLPVALTVSIWEKIHAIPERLQGIEDIRGRAHDVLAMAAFAARRSPQSSEVAFTVVMNLIEGRRVLGLICSCHLGDSGEPVITIGFPEDF